MAKRNIGDIALLPIKPKFAEAILTGNKRVEFRRQNFKRNVTHIVIYSSSPIRKIMGYFNVNQIKKAKPLTLWKRYKSEAGIDRKSYLEYYQGTERGIAIEIGKKNILTTPIDLAELSAELRAPQNYKYLNNELLHKINMLPHQIIG